MEFTASEGITLLHLELIEKDKIRDGDRIEINTKVRIQLIDFLMVVFCLQIEFALIVFAFLCSFFFLFFFFLHVTYRTYFLTCHTQVGAYERTGTGTRPTWRISGRTTYKKLRINAYVPFVQSCCRQTYNTYGR